MEAIQDARRNWGNEKADVFQKYGTMEFWDVGKIENTDGLFEGFDQPDLNLVGWNTSKVTSMTSMFQASSVINANINHWDVGGVTDMSAM